MREIKFRAWVRLTNESAFEMVKVEELVFRNGEIQVNMFLDDFGPMYYGQNIGAIMQFTGLHDKNGSEIFEGDILRVAEKNSHGEIIGNGALEIVKFGGWQSDREEGGYCYGYCLEFINEWLEVVGNIYEHPEILSSPAADGGNT